MVICYREIIRYSFDNLSGKITIARIRDRPLLSTCQYMYIERINLCYPFSLLILHCIWLLIYIKSWDILIMKFEIFDVDKRLFPIHSPCLKTYTFSSDTWSFVGFFWTAAYCTTSWVVVYPSGSLWCVNSKECLPRKNACHFMPSDINSLWF